MSSAFPEGELTFRQFQAAGEELGGKAHVLDGVHGYFRGHANRLYNTCKRFGLFSNKLGDVLEVGPFYSYTPFILRSASSSYMVIEGDDPIVYPLEPLYKDYSIDLAYTDFFEVFGPTKSASHRLSLPDNRFDTILCWETMEHFNFNPIKFVRELYRILKPGGKVCVTVPNKASVYNLLKLIFGKHEKSGIDSFYQFEDYESNGKKAFFGFHWREYSSRELHQLFHQAGFKVQVSGSFNDFISHPNISLSRHLARTLYKAGTFALPRYRSNIYLIASK